VPSAFAHAAPALALIPAFAGGGTPKRLWALGVLCAIAPDADVAAFALGIPYEHPLGHRGLSHSLAFAAVLAAVATLAAFPRARAGFSRARAFAYLFLATASHGLLDACTDGGLGVALLAPFSDARFFAPLRPIEVSPIGVARFFSERGARILANEALWVGLPSALFAAAAVLVRRAQRAAAAR
jgi:inner membrane protein